jgi:excisionase family DNA binding protein
MHGLPYWPGRLLVDAEAAAYLGVSRRTIANLVRRGKLPVVRPTPRSVRFTLADLDAYATSVRDMRHDA